MSCLILKASVMWSNGLLQFTTKYKDMKNQYQCTYSSLKKSKCSCDNWQHPVLNCVKTRSMADWPCCIPSWKIATCFLNLKFRECKTTKYIFRKHYGVLQKNPRALEGNCSRMRLSYRTKRNFFPVHKTIKNLNNKWKNSKQINLLSQLNSFHLFKFLVNVWESEASCGKQHRFTEIIFLALVSCTISWLYFELQLKESNESLAFNNCNRVNLATRKYLK